jgi:hypothetical protein
LSIFSLVVAVLVEMEATRVLFMVVAVVAAVVHTHLHFKLHRILPTQLLSVVPLAQHQHLVQR